MHNWFVVDVHRGIYAIFSRNLTTNRTETLVDAFPGGASRPELSRDGRTLAFVRRVRDKEALVLKYAISVSYLPDNQRLTFLLIHRDLHTGTIHHTWHGLTYDLSTVSAPMGTYPSFAFAPSDNAIIIWAAGQIYSVPLAVNNLGEKIAASGTTPTPIRFTAHIEKRLAETLRGGADIVGLETQDTQRVRAFKELRVDDHGKRVVFQAAGVTFVQEVGAEDPEKVPVLYPDAPYYSPSFVHLADHFVIHARWSDTNFTALELADLESGFAYELEGLPLGRYFSPVLCECSGAHRQIAVIKTDGDLLTGNIVATAGAGLYIGDVTLPSSSSGQREKIVIRDLRFVPSQINMDDVVKMRFVEKNTKLIVQQSNRAFIIDLGAGPKEPSGEYAHHTLASGKMSTEIVVSPRVVKHGTYIADNIAFVDFFHVYFAPANTLEDGEAVWSKPANATKGLVRLSLDGGHDVSWSRDGKKVFWFLGDNSHKYLIFGVVC